MKCLVVYWIGIQSQDTNIEPIARNALGSGYRLVGNLLLIVRFNASLLLCHWGRGTGSKECQSLAPITKYNGLSWLLLAVDEYDQYV